MSEKQSYNNTPRVGVGVFIFKDDHFLIGKRISGHNHHTWSLPGGHLEWGESFEDAAQRETLEETNIQIKNIRFITALNTFFEKEQKHYVTLMMASEWSGNDIQCQEPEKYQEWRWHKWGTPLPSSLFLTLESFLKLNIDPRK